MSNIRQWVAVLGILMGVGPALTAQTTLSVPGDYDTIQEAVTAAGPDTIIQIAKGDYPETVSIFGKFDLTLESKGGRVLDPVGTGLSLGSCTNVRISGLTVENTLEATGDGLSFDGIAISSCSAITLDKVSVLGVINTAVTMFESSEVTLVGVDIERPGNAGISAVQCQQVVVQKCDIQDAGSHGVFFGDVNQSLVVGNKVDGTGAAAIEVDGNDNLVQGNKVTDAGLDGLVVSGAGTANIVQSNSVKVAGRDGMAIGGSGNSAMQNKISDTVDEGAEIDGSSNFVYGNSFKNAGAAILRVAGDDHLIVSNKGSGAGTDGLLVPAGAGGHTIAHNRFSKQAEDGLDHQGDACFFYANKVSSSGVQDVNAGGTDPVFMEAKFKAPKPPAQPVLTVPGDFDTLQAAVDAAADGTTIQIGKGDWTESVVIDGRSDLALVGKGKPRIVSPGASAISILDSDGVSLSGLTLVGALGAGAGADGDPHALLVSGSADVLVDKLGIQDADADGVHVSDSDSVTLSQLSVDGTLLDGVYAGNGSVGVRLLRSKVTGTGGHGVFFEAVTQSLIQGNGVTAVGAQGIKVDGRNVVVEGNKVSATGGLSMHVDDDGAATANLLMGNAGSASGSVGVFLEGTGNASLGDSHKGAASKGVLIDGSYQVVLGAKITSPLGDGLELAGTGHRIAGCSVTGAGIAGLFLSEGCSAAFVFANKIKKSLQDGIDSRGDGLMYVGNGISSSGGLDIDLAAGSAVFLQNKFSSSNLP